MGFFLYYFRLPSTYSIYKDTQFVQGGELLVLGPRLSPSNSWGRVHPYRYCTLELVQYLVLCCPTKILTSLGWHFSPHSPVYCRAGLMTNFASEKGRPSRIPRWVIVRDLSFFVAKAISAISCCTCCVRNFCCFSLCCTVFSKADLVHKPR